MDFALTEEQRAITDSVKRICDGFGDEYWLRRDREGGFPQDFYEAMAAGGWLGICTSEALGGAGLGVTEAALMMRAVTESGAGMAGASAIHMNIFGLKPVDLFGTDAQKWRMIPPIAQGREKACFAVTEPDTGLNTTQLKLFAHKRGGTYHVSGQKIWISTAQVADRMLLLARTTPLEEVKSAADGLSLFYTRFDRERITVREIDKMGRKCVDSNEVFFDDLRIPGDDLIGEEGKGFRYILHGMNAERILVAAEAVGLGMAALARATHYARERVVLNRPIGQNQGVQHPLAQSWCALDAAWLMTLRAAWLCDRGEPCGVEANAAKYLAAEACFDACQTAVMTHGGFGYAKEYHVERYLREAVAVRIAPISPQLLLCFVAEKALGLPKSY
ncbi:MAG: acyl-CoA dehydrogenase [Alphaproteobacteria bacterium HGW-Alphaproteobacteria-5]|jgi:acyl-CoA dehydrogenase|nr:MAG: acyl-CoA dehydrogenase [Alphaproteobacteria bacterium HGW-Alphaproteobacteria-5]